MPPESTDRVVSCAQCGSAFTTSQRTGRPQLYCSAKCKGRAAGDARRARDRVKIVSRPQRVCANEYCGRPFTPGKRSVYCSRQCCEVASLGKRNGGDPGAAQAAAIRYGMLKASRIFWHNCQDCGATFAHRAKRCGLYTCCRSCAAIRLRRTDARRNHKRRAAGRPVLSAHELADRDGRRCHICGKAVDMSRSGMAKWGPTIDHLVPITKGGTNDPENLALAHRYCNISRSNRGPAQLLLTA